MKFHYTADRIIGNSVKVDATDESGNPAGSLVFAEYDDEMLLFATVGATVGCKAPDERDHDLAAARKVARQALEALA